MIMATDFTYHYSMCPCWLFSPRMYQLTYAFSRQSVSVIFRPPWLHSSDWISQPTFPAKAWLVIGLSPSTMVKQLKKCCIQKLELGSILKSGIRQHWDVGI